MKKYFQCSYLSTFKYVYIYAQTLFNSDLNKMKTNIKDLMTVFRKWMKKDKFTSVKDCSEIVDQSEHNQRYVILVTFE